MKELIRTSEANHKSYRDDEFAKDSEKTTDLETQVATHSSKLEAAVSTSSVSDGEVPELQGDLCALFAHELKTDATSADERKIFAMTKEDLEPDDNPIIENTQISHPLHANTDVLDGEVQQHTVEQVVDVPVSHATVEERISECIEQSIAVPVCQILDETTAKSGEVAALHVDLGTQSAQPLRMNAMRVDEQLFVTTKCIVATVERPYLVPQVMTQEVQLQFCLLPLAYCQSVEPELVRWWGLARYGHDPGLGGRGARHRGVSSNCRFCHANVEDLAHCMSSCAACSD